MPDYLFKVRYVGEGVKGLLAEGGSKRAKAAEEVAASRGASVASEVPRDACQVRPAAAVLARRWFTPAAPAPTA